MAIKSIEIENEEQYKLYALKTAYDKMRAYVELCDFEIGWHGLIKKLENKKGFILTDVYLLKQEVNSGTCEIDENAELEYFDSMSKEQQSEFIGVNRLWGHSHNTMSAFASGQDDNQGEEHAKDVEDFYIRLITNKKNEYHITIYDREHRLKVILDELIVYDPANIELRAFVKKEIEEKVSEKKSISVYSKTYDYPKGKESFKKEDEEKTEEKTTPIISKYSLSDIFNNKDYEMAVLFT